MGLKPRARLSHSQIIQLESLNHFQPLEAIGILGYIFEFSRKDNDITILEKGIRISNTINKDALNEYELMIFHYNLANGYSYLQDIKIKLKLYSKIDLNLQDLVQEILNLRLALKYSINSSDKDSVCRILTNLGNLFSRLGRFSESIHYWEKAICLKPDFYEAIGNYGISLLRYSNFVYDYHIKLYFLKLSQVRLNECLATKRGKDNLEDFTISLNYVNDILKQHNPTKQFKFKQISLGRTKGEKNYREWCLKNRFYLNPLNDITEETFAACDSLSLPPMFIYLNKPLINHQLFNQIKQEYVSARYFLYESAINYRTHFSDNRNLLVDTLDYACYSLSIEKLKISFRSCYSILDKISFLLNEYLNLGIHYERVNFKNIWFIYNKKSPTELRSCFSEKHNIALQGLYWLSRDIYDKEHIDYIDAIEPDAKEIGLIRNHIEHKSFMVVDIGDTNLINDKFTYQISRTDFENKTYKLFKIVRSAIIYLTLGIHIEERKNKKSEHIPVSILFDYKEEYKC